MVTIKVLQRKDAAAVLVAIVLAFMFHNVISDVGGSLTQALVGTFNVVDRSFTQAYFYPVLLFIIKLIFLEAGLRAAIFIRAAYLKSQL